MNQLELANWLLKESDSTVSLLLLDQSLQMVLLTYLLTYCQ